MVTLIAPTLVLIVALALGVYAGSKANPIFIVLFAFLLSVANYALVYNATLLPVQYAHMGPGSEPVALRKTAVDFAMAKRLAEFTAIGAVIVYAIGCFAGLKRKSKGAADA